jgi:hypothetical protein
MVNEIRAKNEEVREGHKSKMTEIKECIEEEKSK